MGGEQGQSVVLDQPRAGQRSPWYAVPAIVVAGALLFGFHVGHRGLWSAHEGRAAQNARSIVDGGQWLMPALFTDDHELQKPPFFYWLVAATAELGGREVDAVAVRMPVTISAVLGLVLVYQLGRRMWNWKVGLYAAGILATTTRYAWLARVGRIDMPLCLCWLAGLYSFWRIMDQAASASAPGAIPHQPDPPRYLRWLFHSALAIGILLKGPVAIALFFLPVATYLWAVRQPWIPGFDAGWKETWRRLGVVPGLAWVCLLVAPWYGYAIWATEGRFFWEFVVYHNVERALGTTDTLKSGPIWFYVPRLLVDQFPWSLLLPALAVGIWKHRAELRPGPAVPKPESGAGPDETWTRTYTFLLTAIGSLFVFISLVSFKRPDYLLPVFPPLALLLAGWLHDRVARFEYRQTVRPIRNPRRRARLIQASAYVLAGLTLPLLVWGIIAFLERGVVEAIFELDPFDRYLNETDHFMMSHLERLLRDHWVILAIGLVVVVVCVGMLHTGWHDRRTWKVLVGFACPWTVCYLAQIHLLLPAIDELRDMSGFAEEIRTLATWDRPIHYFGKFDDDLVFHAGKPARLVRSWDELARLGESSEPVFVVMKQQHFDLLAGELAVQDPRLARWFPLADNRHTPLGEHRQPRVLVTNRPVRIARRSFPSPSAPPPAPRP